MGFDANAIKFLVNISKQTKLGKTLTLGRQTYQVDEQSLFNILERNGLSQAHITSLLEKDRTYTEHLLQELGATEVHSIDAAEYESATFIHDMNLPVPASLKGQYDTVIDAGTLEHIFNFPVAVRNCMEMLKVNGHFIGITITNNFPGHGFYQFSPELFFRIFSEENGFVTKKIFLAVNEPGDYWYEIPDPKEVRKRVIFENSKQSFLLVLAQKIAEKEIFSTIPQQSDYEHLAWQGKDQFPVKKKTLLQKLFFFLSDHSKKKIRYKLRVLDPKAWKIFLNNTGSGAKTDFRKTKTFNTKLF